VNKLISSHAQEIQNWLHEHATGETPPDGYTGSAHKHLGVRAPVMQAFVRDWAKANKELSYSEFLAMMDALYQGESIEERCITGYFLGRYPAYRRQIDFVTLDKWLGQLEGWAEVDSSCFSSFDAQQLLGNWDNWRIFLVKLAQDSNINKRRASLVLLRLPLKESNDSRLLHFTFEQIDRLKAEKDKLITKAISWILREAIKHHKEAIAAYLDANEKSLPAIAVRETRKKLETGKK
jgi:3-methyladenine DNA glycosylase AlkD